MTFAPDKIIFDVFRELTGPLMRREVDQIKMGIADYDAGKGDHKLFEIFADMDDDDRISPYEFERIKGAVQAYSASKERNKLSSIQPIAITGNTAANDLLSARVVGEVLAHEGMVLEAYRDSKRIWTWGVGVTNASGHKIDRYRNNPQSVEKVVQVYVWLLQEKYAADVIEAFENVPLTEAQFAAALSFHYNTGAIKRAHWVKHWLRGDKENAKLAFMNYRRPPEIKPRREAERDLFFDGKWTGEHKTTIYPVRKPSYQPDWARAKRVDISADIARALA